MLFGTRVPLPSDSAKNLGFHFFKYQRRELGLITCLFLILWHSCLETVSSRIHSCCFFFFFLGEFNAMKGEICRDKERCGHPNIDKEESERQSHLPQTCFWSTMGLTSLCWSRSPMRRECGALNRKSHRGQLVGEVTWLWLSLRWVLPFPEGCKAKDALRQGNSLHFLGENVGANVNS